jgi:hypothetical protein
MNTVYNQYRKGDTWEGREYIFPFDLTGCTIVCQFKVLSESNIVAFSYKSEDNTIIINDSVNGKITFQSRIMDYPVAIYNYDIQITFPSGRVSSYATDKMTIFTDVTRII